jgi:hypothetical protein
VNHSLRRSKRLYTAPGLTLAGFALLVLLLVRYVTPESLSGPSVRGILLDVAARSIIHADEIVLRDESGQIWTFRVSTEVATNREEPQSASHLRQHMAVGDMVFVRYQPDVDGYLAVRVFDVSTSSPGPGR